MQSCDLGERTTACFPPRARASATITPKWRAALRCGSDRRRRFPGPWTPKAGRSFLINQINGYCYYADNAEQLFVRPRMVFDNPTPSANGSMLVVLTRLALFTGDLDYMNRASTLGQTFGNEANRALNGAGGYLAGLEYLVNSLVILVIGHKGHSRTQELVRAFWSKPLPNAMLVQIEPGEPLPAQHPAAGRGMEGGHPTAYICQAGSCSNPFTNAAEMAWALTLPPQLRAQQQAQMQQPQQQQPSFQPARF